MAKIYCDAIDCAFCLEEEPCIYIIANKLDEENEKLRQRIKELEDLGNGTIHKQDNKC